MKECSKLVTTPKRTGKEGGNAPAALAILVDESGGALCLPPS